MSPSVHSSCQAWPFSTQQLLHTFPAKSFSSYLKVRVYFNCLQLKNSDSVRLPCPAPTQRGLAVGHTPKSGSQVIYVSIHSTSDTKYVGLFFPTPTNSPTFQIPTGCSTIQLNSETHSPGLGQAPWVKGSVLPDCPHFRHQLQAQGLPYL